MIQAVIFDFWGVVFNPMTGEAQEGLEGFIQDLRARAVTGDITRDIKCAIASSSSRQFIVDFLEPRHLLDDFSVIVTIDDVTNTKPDPECYVKAASQLGIAVGDCLVIDDSQQPVEMARQAGFQAIAFGTDVKQFGEIDLGILNA